MSRLTGSAVTVSLVPEAAGGPFVFWNDLPHAIREAARIGFDGLEVFAPGPDLVPANELGRMLKDHGLQLAAVGTGAGWVLHQLSLTDPDPSQRRKAIDFVRSMIAWGAEAGLLAGSPAPAIIGSMQGRHGGPVSKETATGWLADALAVLADEAQQHGTQLLIEPLNRYESNLLNTLAEGSALIRRTGHQNLKLLADLFHMNIEEENSAIALREAGNDLGHIHFVDSNRRPAGNGQIDFVPVINALESVRYQGYLSAETRPWPDSTAAAETTMKTFKRLVGSSPWQSRTA